MANLLLAFPWMVHFAIDIEVIILTFWSNAEVVVERTESNLFCHLKDNTVASLVNATIIVLSMALLIPLEVWTGIKLYKHRKIHTDADLRGYLTVYIRIAACTVVACAAFGLSVTKISTVKADSRIQDLGFPCLSMAMSLIFASQQDLVDVWLCRRRQPLSSSSFELVCPIARDHNTPGEEPKSLRYKPTWNSDSSGHN